MFAACFVRPQEWASHLQGDAARITSADLAAHAHRLADDANKKVELVKQVRSDTSTPADPSAPPSWAKPNTRGAAGVLANSRNESA